MAYPDTETAAEHLRNALQLLYDLRDRYQYDDVVQPDLAAIDARITAALEKLEPGRTPR